KTLTRVGWAECHEAHRVGMKLVGLVALGPPYVELSRTPAQAFGIRGGFSRVPRQSSSKVLSSSTVTPPWSSPEFQRSMIALWRSRRTPLGRNRPWNFLRILSRGSAGVAGALPLSSALAAAACFA